MSTKKGPPALGDGVASRLLDLLSTDDDFRTLFEQDPHAALARTGYTADAAGPSHAECLQLKAGQSLAPKSSFLRDRDRLQAALQLPMTFTDSTALSEG